MATKRLRIFAGPNGSGKSTLLKVVSNKGIHLGIYINADDLKAMINENHLCSFDDFGLILDFDDFKNKLISSSLFTQAGGLGLLSGIGQDGNLMVFNQDVNDYFTSFLSDYLRQSLLCSCDKFTFETVMSHPSKLDFIKSAKEQGFRIYLYFVALNDPEMNKGRVETRVLQGGHDVPADKIVERYERTMNLLLDVIRLSDRAFLFDNSYSEPKLFATVEANEISIEDSVDFVPGWFQLYVLDKLL
ncbi:hypothetical protein [uncultured Parabacteroides sp.]|uniref:hypothetical protein n=1 Tax=uncultured Parabacteroides sp. TaxID=512312 RepID=UPI002632C64C|nr:hypothetical protein [uncultured Parabacteroides sp.]